MKTRPMILCALFAALTTAGAFFKIPFPLAAISLQFFMTAMAGALLGAKYGALSQAVYVLAGLAGAPVFSLGGGLSYVLQPTFGFVLGLIPGAYLIGRLTKPPLRPRRVFLASLAALAAVYAVGLCHLALIANGYLGSSPGARALFLNGMLVYLPGDLVKITAVSLLAPAVARRLPQSLWRL